MDLEAEVLAAGLLVSGRFIPGVEKYHKVWDLSFSFFPCS
jgi:hypothetical protein